MYLVEHEISTGPPDTVSVSADFKGNTYATPWSGGGGNPTTQTLSNMYAQNLKDIQFSKQLPMKQTICPTSLLK